MGDKSNWREYVIPIGKHKGWTMFQAYVNDYDYVEWMAENIDNPELKAAAQDAVEHKNRVDPFSRPGSL